MGAYIREIIQISKSKPKKFSFLCTLLRRRKWTDKEQEEIEWKVYDKRVNMGRETDMRLRRIEEADEVCLIMNQAETKN